MKKQALEIFRMYRKCLGVFCCHYPNDFSFWRIYRAKMDGVLDMCLYSDEISLHEYEILKKYVDKKMHDMHKCYFN